MCDLDIFLQIYFIELEKKLNTPERRKEIQKLEFHQDEANTDLAFKKFIKDFIESNYSKLELSTFDKTVVFDNKVTFDYKSFEDYKINHVFLPSELTPKLKDKIRVKDRVYTDPDLLLEVDCNSKEYVYVPLELKSTKTNIIPGSSVQQIDGDEWVVFVKNTSAKTEVLIGKYFWALNEKMQFPDRSPRPSLDFSTLNKWIDDTINLDEEQNIFITNQNDLEKQRKKLINNWQDVLIERWLDEIKKSSPSRGWYNKTLRLYTYKLIEHYNSLEPDQQKEFENHLRN